VLFFLLLPKIIDKKKDKIPHKKIAKKTKKKKERKKMSEQQQPASPPANRLYVGNIPWSTTVEELQALFADATSVEIPTVRRFRRLLFRCGALVFF
jgi:RNA recognition motif-containing protein